MMANYDNSHELVEAGILPRVVTLHPRQCGKSASYARMLETLEGTRFALAPNGNLIEIEPCGE